jgi:hypothetical protein
MDRGAQRHCCNFFRKSKDIAVAAVRGQAQGVKLHLDFWRAMKFIASVIEAVGGQTARRSR